MSKHTPGPWVVRSEFVGPLRVWADDELIALVGADDFSVCSANAELIAAAPDLLEALELFLCDLHYEESTWDKARAAVKKARGS